MKKLATAAFFLLGLVSAPVSAQFNHPGVVFTTQDLDRMRANRDVEPWRTGYNILLNDSKSSLDYEMKGPHRIVDRNGQNFGDFNDDMDAIYFQAIQYYMTRDDRYAESVIDMIEPWASTFELLGGNVPAIAAADRGKNMLVASEILRYNYDGWTNNLTQITERMAREVLLPPLYLPDPTRHANQGSTQMAGAIAVAVYMNDETLFNQIINAFLNEPCSGISNTLSNGATGDTGRDYGHAFGMILNHAQTAETAHQQGIDLFATLDNRILAATEYWNAYGLGVDVPYTPYGTCYDFFPTIGEGGRGFSDHNTNILLEVVNGAYNVRKGIPNPFTTERINDIPASINTFLFKKDVDNTTSTAGAEPYAPHTGSTDNELTGARIGDPDNTSSSFDSNRDRWTLTASNGDVNGAANDDSFQFAYKRMDGDATIITRVNNLSSSNSNAKAGLMFRESLSDSSDGISVYGHNSGMTHSTWRDQNLVNSDLLRADGSSTNSYRDENMPAWLKIEVNEDRVSTFYAPDSNSPPADETWSPVSTAFFDVGNDFYLGVFVASNNNATVTGVFDDVEVLTGGGEVPADPIEEPVEEEPVEEEPVEEEPVEEDASAVVTIFDFRGFNTERDFATFGVGIYTDLGRWNDDISSIEIPDGLQVTACDDAAGTTNCATFTSSAGTLNPALHNSISYLAIAETGSETGDPDGPDRAGDWVMCATENGECDFSGTKTVAYGDGNSWNYQVESDGVDCNNSTFGDPIRGTVKACFYDN